MHHLCDDFEVQDGESPICPGLHLERRPCVLNRSKGIIHTDIHLSRIKTIPAVHGERKEPPVQSSVLWFLFSTSVPHQSVCCSFEGDTSERYFSASAPGHAAVHHQLAALPRALLSTSTFKPRPGVVINVRKLDFEPAHRVQ